MNTASAFRPSPMLDRPGGHWARKGAQKIVASVAGLRFLEALRISFDWTAAPVRRPARFAVVEPNETSNAPDSRTAACLHVRFGKCACHAQAGATPTTPDSRESAHPSAASELRAPSAQPPTVDDICRALEQSAAENALPVEFFARVIWQESRFDARAVRPRGRKELLNLCRGPPVGTASLTRSSRSRRCGIRLLTYENCSTDLATLDLPQRRTGATAGVPPRYRETAMPSEAESRGGPSARGTDQRRIAPAAPFPWQPNRSRFPRRREQWPVQSPPTVKS